MLRTNDFKKWQSRSKLGWKLEKIYEQQDSTQNLLVLIEKKSVFTYAGIVIKRFAAGSEILDFGLVL